jgi:5-methyltetrahydrofolate--homocysteine methyltransferase
VSVGLNCSFGAEDMLPYLEELSVETNLLVTAHPNAGLPDGFGMYRETPAMMAATIAKFLDKKLVNVIGGCCGTTPDHIAAIRKEVDARVGVRKAPNGGITDGVLRLSGLEMLEIKPENNFVNIGERCNVAGSRKFLRLIKEKNYAEALQIARKQVEDGALIIDINMDDGMLDAPREMKKFLNLLASEPDIAKVPLMIDSSNKDVIREALKCVQGKCVVNSISLKEGEESFLEQARMIHRMGAAMVVMAFDEDGQATSFERRIAICSRAYKLLTAVAGIPAEDIIFDPNILAVATGIEEHDSFAADFINATAWIKNNLPGAKVSGGVSNLSFAFRGNNMLREAMHAVFLYHAIQAGMDMAILNPATAVTYSDIPVELRNLLEDVILNRRKGAAEELAEYARVNNPQTKSADTAAEPEVDRHTLPIDERLREALVKGIDIHLEEDIAEALEKYPSAVSIIDGPLMDGMNRVGVLFGEGKMFLPQVVKTARTMKRAVAILRPAIEAEKRDRGAAKAGTIVIATVKGDVHDIGKNIVAIVLGCNNYEVVDLGVMVPAADIVAKAKEVNADLVCLSGLITPSLAEMVHVAEEMQNAGLNIPILVGGATTSRLHTAVRISPNYTGTVIHVSDAARNPIIAAKLLNPATRADFIASLNAEYDRIRSEYEASQVQLVSLSDARKSAKYDFEPACRPNVLGRSVIDIPISKVEEFINWTFFFHAWKLETGSLSDDDKCECGCSHSMSYEKHQEAHKLYDDARSLIDKLKQDGLSHIKGIVGLYEACSDGDDILIDSLRIPTLRQQQYREDGVYKSLADYLIPKRSGKTDYAGIFAVTAGSEMQYLYDQYNQESDTYGKLLLQSVCDRLAEAASEWLHCEVRRRLWGYATDEHLSVKELWQNKQQGIRPAVGYPSLPDQTLMHLLNAKLNLAEIGVSVTENGAMTPTATVSGIYIANPLATYFMIGRIDDEQVAEYANKRGLTSAQVRDLLRN